MSSPKNKRQCYRVWTVQEESLFFDLWESNLNKMPKWKTMKKLLFNMHQELSLHFDISLQDMKTKVASVRKQYRRALQYQSIKNRWCYFDRVHSILQKSNQGKRSNTKSPYTISSGTSTDESVWTIDDNSEENESNNNTNSELTTNNIQQPILIASESNEEVIDLDDDDNNKEADELNCLNVNFNGAFPPNIIEPNEFIENFNTPTAFSAPPEIPENQFPTIRPVQTIPTEPYLTNFMPSLNSFQINCEPATSTTACENESLNIAAKVYLCEPIEPQTNIPIPATDTSNVSKTSKKETAKQSKTLKRKKAKPYKAMPKEEKILQNSNEMLKRLASIDDMMHNFLKVQEALTKQICNESISQSILLAQIHKMEKRTTELLECLVHRKQPLN